MGSPRKKIGLLCLLLLVSGGWIAFASRFSAEGGTQKAGDQTERSSFGSDPKGSQTRELAFGDPNLPAAPSISLGNGELFLRMMLSVGLVIGLGAVALYLSKRALPRVVHAGGKEIHILETAYLGPRKAIHLVEVGDQRLLLASTSDSIAMLTPLEDPEPLDMPKDQVEEGVTT